MGGVSPFYALRARSLRGKEISFSHHAGQVVLVVNTASHCGFTPQYAALEALYRKYAETGFVILGFPCNQFGKQEPGDAETIAATCLINYGVSFPVFEKIEVNGPNAHPLFHWLTECLPGLFGRRVKWNFTKFLISRDGTPLRRYAPITPPEKLEQDIRTALGLQHGDDS